MQHRDEHSEDDFEVEFADLPGETSSMQAHLLRLSLRMRPGRRSRRMLTPIIALALVCVLIFTSGPFLYSRAVDLLAWSGLVHRATARGAAIQPSNADRASTEADGIVVVQKYASGKRFVLTPGPTPQDCSADLTSSDTNEARFSPLAIEGFDKPYISIPLEETTVPTLSNWKGWAIPLRLTFKPGHIIPVSLSVGDIGVGQTPTIASSPDATSASSLILDPWHAGDNANHFTNSSGKSVHSWDMTLYVPGSGCYYLVAYWPRGRWQVIFSAGM